VQKPVILVVAGTAEFGSGELLFLDYLLDGREKPFIVELVFPAEGSLVEKAREAGLPVNVIRSQDYLTDFHRLWKQPIAWVYNLRSFVKISSLIRRKQIQLVLSLSFLNWSGALAARQEGISHIWMIREVLSVRANWLNFFWGKWLASRLANDLSVKVLLESALAAEMFRRRRTREKAEVIAPAIDEDRFYAELQTTGSDFSQKEEGLGIFFSGNNLKKVKKVLQAIADKVGGCSAMSPQRPERVYLFFPGVNVREISGIRNKIQKEFNHPNLELEFADINQRKSLLKNFRLAIIISGIDPLSRIVLECGLAGVPVAVEKGPASELVVSGQTGLVFSFEDREELAKMLELANSKVESVRALGQKAIEHIRLNYSLKRWTPVFEEILLRELRLPEG